MGNLITFVICLLIALVERANYSMTDDPMDAVSAAVFGLASFVFLLKFVAFLLP